MSLKKSLLRFTSYGVAIPVPFCQNIKNSTDKKVALALLLEGFAAIQSGADLPLGCPVLFFRAYKKAQEDDTPEGRKSAWEQTLKDFSYNMDLHLKAKTTPVKTRVCDKCNRKFGNDKILAAHNCRPAGSFGKYGCAPNQKY